MNEELIKQLKIEAQTEYDDMQFLLSLLPDWTKEVPKGLDPTFYGTLSYEGDKLVKIRIENIMKRAKQSYEDIMNL